jgi:hypothetical protein
MGACRQQRFGELLLWGTLRGLKTRGESLLRDNLALRGSGGIRIGRVL